MHGLVSLIILSATASVATQPVASIAAQPVDSGGASYAELEECAGRSADEARLRCYMELTERGRAGQFKPPAGSGAQDFDTAAVPDAVSSVIDDTAATSDAVAAGADDDTAGTTARKQAEKARADADFGLEQLPAEQERRRRERRQEETVIATVEEVTTGLRDRLYFRMDNGSLWRQSEPGYLFYPKGQPFEVEISRGLMGEYRMRVEGRGRMVAIRRVE